MSQEKQIVDAIETLAVSIEDNNQQLRELVATLDNLTRWYMEVNGYNANPRNLKEWGKKKAV